jgi:hypothetical protein
MGKVHDGIDPDTAAWLEAQHVFFVATAPMGTAGHVNCSPKGGGALRVLDPRTVAYPDYTGSGAETIAHLRENGRIVLMFCAFEGPPRIVRLHGTGRVVPAGHPDFEQLAGLLPPHPGTRAVIKVYVQRVADSCGYGVPLYDYQGPRETLEQWSAHKGSEGLADYRRNKNATSIDGLPALGP